MAKAQLGITCMAGTPEATLANIKRAESLGIPAAWLTAGGLGVDTMAVFAAAAVQTSRIQLGTCIIPTWPRHPLGLAVQAATISALSGGRFRLGVGPSHKPTMTGVWGFDFRRPLTHLREYVTVLNQALKHGPVNFDGERYQVHGEVPDPPHTPVMISALQEQSFRLAGEMTDGAITWISPLDYVERIGLPAIQEGAEKAGRPVPPIIFHIVVCVHGNVQEVRAAARPRLGNYPKLPFYASMMKEAGVDAASPDVIDALVDRVVAHGDADAVSERLSMLRDSQMGEVIAMVIGAGSDPEASIARGWDVVAKVAKS